MEVQVVGHRGIVGCADMVGTGGMVELRYYS